jgi:alkylation response protein AidB-like acyl-CoA dehydrogenase
MDLDFSEEQHRLRDMVRGLCNEYCGVDVVRQTEDDPTGYPAELWKQLGELGLVGLGLPEAYGGGGQGLLEAAIVYEEFGRALAPTPHFPSAVMCGGVLAAVGSEAQKKAWLPRIASGEAIVVPAWNEPDRGYGEVGVALPARRDRDDWVLDGVKRHVLFASSAERLLVLARSDAGVELFLVDPAADGVSLDQQKSLAGDCQYQVTFDGVRVAESDRVGAPGAGWDAWHAAMLDGIVLLGAFANGGAEKALEITVDYAKERKQFDKPLGAFQAVSHYLADAATYIDGGKTLVYEAAWARDAGRSIEQLAPMSKLFTCNTWRDMTAMCQQVWGGVGFTIEYDIQLFFRRAKQLQITWWDTPYLEELVAATVLDD